MASIVVVGTVASVGGADGAGRTTAVGHTAVEADDTAVEHTADEAEGSADEHTAVEQDSPAPDGELLHGPDRASDDDPAPVPCLVSGRDGTVWRLAFADDFDGAEVDPNQWRLYDSPGNAGHGLRRPAAITTSDGLLVITAAMVDDVLVSGGMAHRLDQIYGRWEFRVRTDPDPSGATSGVILTWPQSENWPIDGENDMYETGPDPDRTPFMTYIHYGADNAQETLTHDADGTEWNTVAMEWTEDRIALYRNGTFVGEIVDPDVIPDVPHHMTVQLDAWADTMGDPVRLEVDWVRVHRHDPTSSAC